MIEIHLIIKRAMPLIFGYGLILTTVMTLIPSTAIPDAFNFWDKAQHALAFATLSLTGSFAYPSKTKLVYIGLILYGACIELMQSTLTATRYGDVLDWLADGTGVVLGLSLYFAFQKFTRSNSFSKRSR